MSETSRDYERGFAKLLPEVWNPLTAVMQYGHEGDHFWSHLVPMPCPDIRLPSNEALAWRAMCKLSYNSFDAWSNDVLNNAQHHADALYAAVEAVGMES